MKVLLLSIIISCGLFFYSSTSQNIIKSKNIADTSAKPDTINFAAQVLPVLTKNCSPCHFTGGKMYKRLPFDKADTITSHEAGVLKRIKDENENMLIKQFIVQETNINP